MRLPSRAAPSSAVVVIALALGVRTAQAQQPATVRGVVRTEAGVPLPRASVVIPALGLGGETDAQGAYSIRVPGARTLKARYYLHTAERVPGAYALALAQANQGIGDATGAGDFRTYQSATVGEQNQWYQFLQQRGTDISAGATLVNLMATRNAGGRDPRFTQYFGTTSTGAYRGAQPSEEGEDFSWLSATRGDPGFRQPLVTWAENQLIKAEALLQTGDAARALWELNAERAQVGLPTVATGLTTARLYQQIMEEKYVALFQNAEVWSDYKYTCWPNLVPGSGARSIPARFFYGATERGANPNIPSPSQQPRRNWNDPVNATSLDGAACLGQRTT